jgi:general secretion pathway protein D
VKSASEPIHYAVENYAVVITPPYSGPPQLNTRVYKVDAKTFVENLDKAVTGEKGDLSVSPIPHQVSQNVNGLLRTYLSGMGVEFPTNQTSRVPGTLKAVFFNDRTGVLFARATPKELDTIERAVQQLTWKPWRVQIETIVAEVETSGSGFADVDLLLGGVPAVNADTNLSSAKMTLEAQPSGQPDASQPLSALTNHLESDVQSRSMTGILSPSQLDLVLRALKQRRGSDLSILSGINAISGSEAKVDWTQTHPMNPEKADQTNGVYYAGSWLDVTPTVSSNHLSVDLRLRATVAEPAHKAGSVTKSDEHGSKSQEDATNDSPEARRYFTSLKSVPDGQTVVWTGPSIVRPYRMIDKVAVLGDIPMLGRLFRSESSGVQTHRLVLFVTATLVDDAGNPIHAPAKEEAAPKGVFPTPP